MAEDDKGEVPFTSGSAATTGNWNRAVLGVYVCSEGVPVDGANVHGIDDKDHASAKIGVTVRTNRFVLLAVVMAALLPARDDGICLFLPFLPIASSLSSSSREVQQRPLPCGTLVMVGGLWMDGLPEPPMEVVC